MKQKEKKVIEGALDELMKGDDGDFGNIVYTLGKLVGREYKQFKPIKAEDIKTELIFPKSTMQK